MIWPQTFEERLPAWHHLRQQVAGQDTESALLAINDWWWQAPMVNHTIYWNDLDCWPDPWQLLAQSGFCDLARALGMLYTVMMSAFPTIQSLELVRTKTHNLVSINREKYILNWSPGTIVNTHSPEFTVVRSIDSNRFTRLIG